MFKRKMDFASDEHERKFKELFTKIKTTAYIEDGNLFIKPSVVDDLKKAMRDNGLEHCPRSNQILAYLDGSANRYLEFRH